jgi:hypothetical protein
VPSPTWLGTKVSSSITIADIPLDYMLWQVYVLKPTNAHVQNIFYDVLLITDMFRSPLRSSSSGWFFKGTKNTTTCQTVKVEPLSIIIVSDSAYGHQTSAYILLKRNSSFWKHSRDRCIAVCSWCTLCLLRRGVYHKGDPHCESLRLYYNDEWFRLHSWQFVLSYYLVKPPWW